MTWSRSAKCKGVVPPGARSSSSRREGAGHKVIGRFISSWGLGLAACEPRESKFPEPEEKIPQTPLPTQALSAAPLEGSLPLRWKHEMERDLRRKNINMKQLEVHG
ncbi:Hypothetical protein SMAX5B_011367 [Scophthalmus maximus]|uniref:Uncharacterized protein n=1 Tax=Scophthalmus maximus TaxID=52904 RepID=A0A2U9BMU0_SCOMX|nr:Hypothetical protein SMAX5B_011367 [Scophthalmus maximus]